MLALEVEPEPGDMLPTLEELREMLSCARC
jgi:hypothetical protein